MRLGGYSEGQVLDVVADSVDSTTVMEGRWQLTGAEQKGFGSRQCRHAVVSARWLVIYVRDKGQR